MTTLDPNAADPTKNPNVPEPADPNAPAPADPNAPAPADPNAPAAPAPAVDPDDVVAPSSSAPSSSSSASFKVGDLVAYDFDDPIDGEQRWFGFVVAEPDDQADPPEPNYRVRWLPPGEAALPADDLSAV